MKKKLFKYEVSFPVYYYEVFQGFAESPKDAISKALEAGVEANGWDQVCTDANKKRSRRVIVRKCLVPEEVFGKKKARKRK